MSSHNSADGSASMDGDDSSYEHDNEAGKSDPGLKYLREINLASEEIEEYEKLARSWIPALIQFEAGTADDGWRSVATLFGVNVCTKPKPADEGSAQVVCRGQMSLPAEVKLDMIQDQFVKVYNNSVTLAQQMRASDPMSRETKILYQLPCGDDEFIRIVWGSFRAAGVAWARDFCFLQHASMSTDAVTGERLFCVVAGSVERPEVPNMEKLCKRIRSTVQTSGYVCREKADGTVRVSYVVNVNPNGWIPNKIVNTICINQAMNVSRVKAKLVDTAKACAALNVPSTIWPMAVAWRKNFELPIPRPAAGAAASNVSVKFWADNKVSFRIRGASGGATTEWKSAEAVSDFSEGGWVSYGSQTPVSVGFSLQPEGVGGGGGDANGNKVDVADVELHEREACVLEWKAGGWFKGFTVFYVLDVA